MYIDNTENDGFLNHTQTARGGSVMLHLQLMSPPFFDLDRISKHRKSASETRAQSPIVQIAEMGLKSRVDKPLIILLGQLIYGWYASTRVASKRLGCSGSLRRAGVHMRREG